MIIKLQFTDPERLSNKEGSLEVAWTSLKRRNRIDAAGRPEGGEDGNGRDWAGEEGWRERIQGEKTGIGEHLAGMWEPLVVEIIEDS